MKAKHNKTLLLACAACTLFLGTAPARAADNLQCALSLRNVTVDQVIYAAYRSGNLGQTLRDWRGSELAACATQNKWSPKAAESAGHVYLGEVMAAGVKADFIREKLSADRLAAWLEGYLETLPPAKLQKLADGSVSQSELEIDLLAIMTELAQLGILSDEQLAVGTNGLIGEYLVAKARVLFYRERFKGQ